MPTYQYGVTVFFSGSLANVRWAERQVMTLVQKAKESRELQVNLEAHGGAKKEKPA